MRKLNTKGQPKSDKPLTVKKTIKAVKPGEKSSVEIEDKEYVVGDFTRNGFPQTFVASGKRHSSGGMDINAPDNTFVFSRDKTMRITDPNVLESFGKSAKKIGYDPAAIAKQYDNNDFLRNLLDPDSDHLMRDTAESMIKNNNEKLGKLSLAQEALKGFDQGIPFIALPYMQQMGMDPASLVHGSGDEPVVPTQGEDIGMSTAKTGGTIRIKITGQKMQKGGGLSSEISRKKRMQDDAEKFADEHVAKYRKEHGAVGQLYDIVKGATKDAAVGAYTSIQNAQTYFTKPIVERLYKGAADRAAKGDVSSDWSWLPGVSDASTEYAMAQLMAEQAGLNPQEIEQKMFKKPVSKSKPVVKHAPLVLPPVDKTTHSDTTYVADKSFLQKGGSVQKAVDGSTKTTMPDGTVIIKDPKGTVVKTILGQEHVYTPVALKNMETLKGLGYDIQVPGTLQDVSGAVKTTQSKMKDAYGRKDWTSSELFPDFRNRQSWYFKDHPEFNPKKEADVKDFQNAYNARLQGMGLPAELNVDGKFGEHTYSAYGLTSKQPNAPGMTQTPQGVTPTPQGVTPTNPIPVNPLADPMKASTDNPFWTEDLVNLSGALGDYGRIKKYMPWQAGYATTLPNAHYADPTRELAANAEQANIAENAIGAYAGPQELGSRISQIQGNAFKNAADILGKYNNMNIQVANQNEMQRTQIMNTDSLNRANRSTEFYNQGVAANQNFDNAKAMARQNIRQAFNAAWQHRGQTQALNSINKQYRVSPKTGFVEFKQGVPEITPDQQRGDALEYMASLAGNANIKADPALLRQFMGEYFDQQNPNPEKRYKKPLEESWYFK